MPLPLGAGRERPLPLSPDQERMWLFDRQLAASVSYDDPLVARLRGPLRPAALAAALDRVVARHESLRTRFPVHDGTPQQQVAPHAPVPVRLVDLTGLAGTAREPALDRLLAGVLDRPFDLERGPPYWAVLLRLAPDEHVVLLVVHHLAADLWSMAVLVDELSTGYRTATAGTAPRLPPPGAQPVELAGHERRRLTPRRVAALRQHWSQRLAGAQPAGLPADRPRPARPHLGVHVYRSRLDGPLSDAVRGFSTAEGVTLFVSLLAGFQALLARWTGQDDFVVRSVAAGRRGGRTERAVGLLTRCLVLRLDTAGDPTVRQLLARTREAALDAIDGTDLPFAEVVALADPARDRDPSPLRQLGLSVHNVPRTAPVLDGGLSLVAAGPSRPALATGVSEADLWLEVLDAGHGPLELHLKMDDQLYRPETLFRTRQQLAILLAEAVARPTARLSDLDLPAAAWPEPPHRAEAAGPAAGKPATVRAIAALTGAVLGTTGLRGPENFFQLGGGSLDAVRLVDRIRRELGVAIGLSDVLAGPTVSQVAATVDHARASDHEAGHTG